MSEIDLVQGILYPELAIATAVMAITANLPADQAPQEVVRAVGELVKTSYYQRGMQLIGDPTASEGISMWLAEVPLK